MQCVELIYSKHTQMITRHTNEAVCMHITQNETEPVCVCVCVCQRVGRVSAWSIQLSAQQTRLLWLLQSPLQQPGAGKHTLTRQERCSHTWITN